MTTQKQAVTPRNDGVRMGLLNGAATRERIEALSKKITFKEGTTQEQKNKAMADVAVAAFERMRLTNPQAKLEQALSALEKAAEKGPAYQKERLVEEIVGIMEFEKFRPFM